MKEINLNLSHKASMTVDMNNLPKPDDMGCINLGTLDLSISFKEIQTARENGGRVLYGAIELTQKIENILCDYLFGVSVRPSNEKSFFRYNILQSSSFSSDFKRQALGEILKTSKLISVREQRNLDKNIRQFFKWRNAFAHGDLSHDNNLGTSLKYHSGASKTLKLDDAFWSDLEATYIRCTDILDLIQEQISNKSQN